MNETRDIVKDLSELNEPQLVVASTPADKEHITKYFNLARYYATRCKEAEDETAALHNKIERSISAALKAHRVYAPLSSPFGDFAKTLQWFMEMEDKRQV